MYSSIPPCELSIEWENLVHDNKEKKKVILVVPNQENENVQKFIREVAEILENSNTFTCIMLIKTDLIYKFIKKNAPLWVRFSILVILRRSRRLLRRRVLQK